MPFNGSGVYSPPSNSWAPAVGATTISSADWNTLRADLVTALNTCLLKDGQQTVTANLPMATYRHTGVGDAQALTDYASANQVVDNALCYGGASAAGTDTYAVNLAVSPGAYAAGQRYSFIADVANTGACTINFNTIGAADIKLQDGSDPYDGAIIANQLVELMYDGTNMVILNPELDYAAVDNIDSASGVFSVGASPTLYHDVNVSSVSRVGTGNYTVTLSNAMSDTNYGVIVSIEGDVPTIGDCTVLVDNNTPKTTTAFGIRIFDVSNNLTDAPDLCSFMIIGN